MMFKCNNCEHIFESGEEKIVYERHGLECPPYEKIAVCPICEGNFREFEIEKCTQCENEKNFVYNGLCEDCLIEMVDYENGLDYIIETKSLAYFIFTYFYKMEYPKVTTAKFDEELRMIFLRKKVEDLHLGKKELLEMIVDFAKDDISNFADFLKERGEI
jgi:hypothetical protein